MLTIFSIPKPFAGDTARIQRNALRSWAALEPRCEILLLGDDEGVAQAAAEEGARHVPGAAKNEFGTPLLDGAFAEAERQAAGDTLCYVNADVVLLSDFVPAARRVGFHRFLLAGQRFDLEVPDALDVGAPGWEAGFRARLAERGSLHPPAGSDYFVFRRGTLGALPAFAVGRPGWDNWLIFRARELGMPVVDASAAITVVHQNHGYGHVPGGTGRSYMGPEGQRNLELAGGAGQRFTLDDATHVMDRAGVRRATGDRYLRRRIDRVRQAAPGQGGRAGLLEWLYGRRGRLGPVSRRLIYSMS